MGRGLWRGLAAAGVVVVLAGAAAGCGDDDDGDAASTPPATDADSPPSSEPLDEPTAEDAEATVQVAETNLGEVLVDASGFTLYLFTQDQGTTSACTGGCAGLWPPLTVDSGEPTGGTSVDAALLGSAPQADGAVQVTYSDHLLYRYSGDAQPGDTNGQAIGGSWFALSPDGERVAG